jgi:hypothetical protein
MATLCEGKIKMKLRGDFMRRFGASKRTVPRYFYDMAYGEKRAAQRRAKDLRESGYLARVTRDKRDYQNEWTVWKGPRRK